MLKFETKEGDTQLLEAGRSRAGWSLYSAILTCPQKAAYREILKLQAPPSFPLARGSLVHQGLAHYYARMQLLQKGEDVNRLYDPVTAVERLASKQVSPVWLEALPDATAAVTAYGRWWEVQGWEILHVEHQLEAELIFSGRKIPYTQRADLIVREQTTGKVYIIDHKTAGKRDLRTDRAYARSGQVQGYFYLGKRFYGDAFAGVILNYIVFYSDRIEFARFLPPYSQNRSESFEATIKWAYFAWEALQGLDPWQYPKVNLDNGACEHRYGACEYARLCDFGPGAGFEDERG